MLDVMFDQKITSYNVAFLSPEPVTIYLSSVEMSQLKTEDDSFDCKKKAYCIMENSFTDP